jgi:bifunctional DNA-binding transcriptional regulator/antitoxin component of YhaV-PrlF toxin-antitoxin module
MVMRVQVVEGEYRIVLPPEAMEELKLKPGAPVDIVPVVEPEPPQHRYMTVEEGLAAFRRIEPAHRNTFRELAK